MILPIMLAVILGFILYYSFSLKTPKAGFLEGLTSFAAGVSLTYILLELFPNFILGVMQIGNFLFIVVLFSFVMIHIYEKYIYRKFKGDKKSILGLIEIEEEILAFFYYIIVGMILIYFSKQGNIALILFYLPIVFHTIVEALSRDLKKNALPFLAMAPLFGVFLGLLFNLPLILNFVMIGFVIGILLFHVTRHLLPSNRYGDPIYLTLGVITYTVIIIFIWNIRLI